jgi:hypothetical protein
MKHLLLLGLILSLAACGVPEESTPAPTPEAIQVAYPIALKPWADKFAGCASTNPLVALYYNQSPSVDTNIISNNVELSLGEPTPIKEASYLSQVGLEQMAIIVNQDNILSQLSSDNLQSIYSGQTKYWDGAPGQRIQVWVLPNGDPVRMYFDSAVLHSYPLTSEALLAPDPEAMLEAISRDANAIGYLPGSFLTTMDPTLVSKAKTIKVDTTLQDKLKQPVVAMTQTEPSGLMRELLICVQAVVP